MYPYPGRICGASGDIPWKPAPVGEGSKVKQKAINSRFHSIYGKNTFQVKPILTEGECLYVTLILQLCDIVAPPCVSVRASMKKENLLGYILKFKTVSIFNIS